VGTQKHLDEPTRRCLVEDPRDSEIFLRRLRRRVSLHERQLIDLAYRLSKYAHRGQTRDGGERYFDHPKSVALILIDELQIYDADMIIAALLHDVVEDTWMLSHRDVALIFGTRVARMVKLLTKERNPTAVQKLRYLKRIATADEDIRIIKLADRLHNVRTLSTCSADKISRNLSETCDVFVPMAQKTNPYLAEQLRKACAEIADGRGDIP